MVEGGRGLAVLALVPFLAAVLARPWLEPGRRGGSSVTVVVW